MAAQRILQSYWLIAMPYCNHPESKFWNLYFVDIYLLLKNQNHPAFTLGDNCDQKMPSYDWRRAISKAKAT